MAREGEEEGRGKPVKAATERKGGGEGEWEGEPSQGDKERGKGGGRGANKEMREVQGKWEG